MVKQFFYIKWFLVAGLALGLIGCAGMNAEFDCSMEPGIQCKSLDEINTMVDQGKIGKKQQRCPENGCNQPITEVTTSDPERMRIWVSAYSDEAGNYHPASMLYLRNLIKE
jgi:hypothetical protein